MGLAATASVFLMFSPVMRGAVACGERRVVQTLYNAGEFDVSVTFDESATKIYAYRYNELKPVLVRG
ncbi:hypothetical protein [Mycobacterium sp.]|uniref:hypothetical protein n=1 Tax=Mycobacterium sp. TaxID=1785 RepID=UPI002B8BF115|nr:hypothetical protein [Mycobacterium sp.]HXB87633.1 hypothetical protein [Mycobacterium sp.]